MVAQDVGDAEESGDGPGMDGQRRGAQRDGVAAGLMRMHDRSHRRKDARGDPVAEQPFTDGLEFRERFAAQVARASHDQAPELHAAEPVSHHCLGDTQNLPKSGLSATDPITGMSGGGEPGNQGAVQVEERAHFGSRRTGGNLREGGRHRPQIVEGHVVRL